MKINHLLIFALMTGAVFSSCSEDNPDNMGKNKAMFEENFDGMGPGISAWKLYSDNNKVNPYFNGVYDPAWIAREMSLYNGNKINKMAVSCAWFSQPGQTADRWMVSPEFEVMGDNPYLYWEESAPDPTRKQGYKLLISDDGGMNKEDFKDVLYMVPKGTPAAVTNTMESVNLSKYKGKKVRIAFVNESTDGFLIAVDNIFLSDKKLASIPINGVQDTVATNSTHLHWSDFDNVQGEYEVALVNPGELPGKESKIVATNTKMATISGLMPGKFYYSYLRSKGDSHWNGPYPIQTSSLLPLSSDMNGNLEQEGWTFEDDAKVAKTSMIDNSQCIYLQAIPEYASFGGVETPPIELKANKKINISFDYLPEELDGEISVWVQSYDPRDNGAGLKTIFLEDIKDKGKVHHFSEVFETPSTDDAYKIIVKMNCYGPKPLGNNDHFKIYVDNIRVNYVK